MKNGNWKMENNETGWHNLLAIENLLATEGLVNTRAGREIRIYKTGK